LRPRYRTPHSLQFLLIAVVLLIVGTVLLLLAVGSFFLAVIRFGLGGAQDFGLLGNSVFTVILVGAIGTALTSAGGWLLRFLFVYLLVKDVSREEAVEERTPTVPTGPTPTGPMKRCLRCGRMNPLEAAYCMTCGEPL